MEMSRRISMIDEKVFGVKVSKYGLENGYLDYYTLAQIVGDRVLNNNITRLPSITDWELVSGELKDNDEIFQEYIITYSGYQILSEYTDEPVYYSEELEMYIWGITHFGTSLDHVLTDIKLEELK